jgi:tetratricopeptide (TPR) repeat protein
MVHQANNQCFVYHKIPKMKNSLTTMAVLLYFIPMAIAQSGLNLPEDNPDTAKEKYVILSDNHDSDIEQEYKEAYACFEWIEANAPDLHETVYIFGLKTIKNMIEHDPDDKELQERLMETYDMRIKYFGHEVKVLSRKAFDAYKYFRNDTARLNETVEIFDYLYQHQKEQMENNLLYPYFDLTATQLANKKIANASVIENYQNISEVIQFKIDNGEKDLDKIQQLIDARLVKIIAIECGSLDKVLPADPGENGMNLQQAKLIVKLSLAYGCQQEPIFFDAIKVIYVEKPTMKIANLIGSYHLSRKEYDIALSYLAQALELAEDDVEKSAVYFDLAKTHYMSGNKIEARKMANEALRLDPLNKDCYRLIGDLYYNSFDDCKKGKSRVQDRSVFYAAYEKYALANDKEKMSNAEQQFPTMEEIHTENYEEGQTINTNCWIGEIVKIRRRPDLASY